MPDTWAFADPEDLGVFTIKRIIRGESPVLLVSHDENDGDWQFLDGADAGRWVLISAQKTSPG